MNRPEFGDVLKIGKWFSQVLSVPCLPQEFKFQHKFVGYFSGHSWGTPTVFTYKCTAVLEIKLVVLCNRNPLRLVSTMEELLEK
jgi:hypothetical protein